MKKEKVERGVGKGRGESERAHGKRRVVKRKGERERGLWGPGSSGQGEPLAPPWPSSLAQKIFPEGQVPTSSILV